jgi:hypothetical protein
VVECRVVSSEGGPTAIDLLQAQLVALEAISRNSAATLAALERIEALLTPSPIEPFRSFLDDELGVLDSPSPASPGASTDARKGQA